MDLGELRLDISAIQLPSRAAKTPPCQLCRPFAERQHVFFIDSISFLHLLASPLHRCSILSSAHLHLSPSSLFPFASFHPFKLVVLCPRCLSCLYHIPSSFLSVAITIFHLSLFFFLVLFPPPADIWSILSKAFNEKKSDLKGHSLRPHAHTTTTIIIIFNNNDDARAT